MVKKLIKMRKTIIYFVQIKSKQIIIRGDCV